MNERTYTRFMLFMNAVDDDLLEEAMAIPKRLRVHWKGLAAVAACLCVVFGALFWQGRTPVAPESIVTAADLAGYGYMLPLPADIQNVIYDLLPSPSETPIAQAEFDRGGHAVTLRAWSLWTSSAATRPGPTRWTGTPVGPPSLCAPTLRPPRSAGTPTRSSGPFAPI